MIIHKILDKPYLLIPTRDITDLIMLPPSAMVTVSPGDNYKLGHQHLIILKETRAFKGELIFHCDSNLFLTVLCVSKNTYTCDGPNGVVIVMIKDTYCVEASTDESLTCTYFDRDESYRKPTKLEISEFLLNYNTFVEYEEHNRSYSRSEVIDEITNMITLFEHEMRRGRTVRNIKEWVKENLD